MALVGNFGTGSLVHSDEKGITVELTALARRYGCKSVIRLAPLPGCLGNALGVYDLSSGVITVDNRLLSVPWGDPSSVLKDIVYHEIVHAKTPGAGHGSRFWIWAVVLALRAGLPLPRYSLLTSWPLSQRSRTVRSYLQDMVVARAAHVAAAAVRNPGWPWPTVAAPTPRVSLWHRIFAALRAFLKKGVHRHH